MGSGPTVRQKEPTVRTSVCLAGGADLAAAAAAVVVLSLDAAAEPVAMELPLEWVAATWLAGCYYDCCNSHCCCSPLELAAVASRPSLWGLQALRGFYTLRVKGTAYPRHLEVLFPKAPVGASLAHTHRAYSLQGGSPLLLWGQTCCQCCYHRGSDALEQLLCLSLGDPSCCAVPAEQETLSAARGP